jgi:hypothetical protein
MKKVQSKQSKKLTLIKMTVAKLALSNREMQNLYGGNVTTKPPKPPTSKDDTIVDPCVLTTPRTNG